MYKMVDEGEIRPIQGSPRPPEGETSLSLRGRRILVVDDHEQIRRVLKLTLDLEGAEVTLAKDGQEALDLLRAVEKPFDLVITDFRMPRVDGLGLVEQVRAGEGGLERHKEVPIIVGSGDFGQIGREEMKRLEAGANAILDKPFKIDDLTSLAAELISAGQEEQG